jgi:hypothetical protein
MQRSIVAVAVVLGASGINDRSLADALPQNPACYFAGEGYSIGARLQMTPDNTQVTCLADGYWHTPGMAAPPGLPVCYFTGKSYSVGAVIPTPGLGDGDATCGADGWHYN